MAGPELLADRWPNDLFLFRHAKPDRDNVPRPDGTKGEQNEFAKSPDNLLTYLPGWLLETKLIDMYQDLEADIAFRQSHALGKRLANIAPLAKFCLSSNLDRSLQTAWEAVKMYPDSNRPKVIPTPLLRERERGSASPILMSKTEFYDRFPEKARTREETPSQWHPLYGESYQGAHVRFNMSLLLFAIERPHDEQLLISTSGEMCIAAFNNPLLGNMSDAQLVQGFGPGMPATEYELTALTRYTKRNPFDRNDPHVTDLYNHMRVMTPDPANPEGELSWDTDWLPINR